MISSATIKGPYRYDLFREIPANVPSKRRLLVVMVNPSTADADKNDHTITKLMGFAELWGYGELVVVNLFAFRATNVRDLKAVVKNGMTSIVGAENDDYIAAHALQADEILVAWGAKHKIPGTHQSRRAFVLSILSGSGKPIFCLGRTKCGQPCHPLTLAYATKREKWFL